jgi:hypothetical protein
LQTAARNVVEHEDEQANDEEPDDERKRKIGAKGIDYEHENEDEDDRKQPYPPVQDLAVTA